MASPEPIRPPAEEVPLREGRRLTLASVGKDELVEIRSAAGNLELRIRLTEDGPVLEMESVRLVLRAQEAVDVETGDFNVKAAAGIKLQGKADVKAVTATVSLDNGTTWKSVPVRRSGALWKATVTNAKAGMIGLRSRVETTAGYKSEVTIYRAYRVQ